MLWYGLVTLTPNALEAVDFLETRGRSGELPTYKLADPNS